MFPDWEHVLDSSAMVMRIVGVKRLDEFCAKHPPTRSWVRSWMAETKNSSWVTPHDIKRRFPSASFIGELVIFNVKGNDYRLVTQVAYQTRVVVVKWVGTHQAYSSINWEKVSNETSSD